MRFFLLLLITILLLSSILLWFGVLFFGEQYQEFGIVSDDCFWYVFTPILFMVGFFYQSNNKGFYKNWWSNGLKTLFTALPVMLVTVTSIDNINYFSMGTTITENCNIDKIVYLENPPRNSEGDNHIYPYYELYLTIDNRPEKLDFRAFSLIDSLQTNHIKTLTLTYRKGLLGTKYLQKIINDN